MSETADPLHTLRRRLVRIGVATVGAAALLAALALASVADERAARREMLAERIFDEMERETSALVSREDARAFLQYRSRYTIMGADGDPLVVRSALADPPAEPWIVGWFQSSPNGSLTTPREDTAAERLFARDVLIALRGSTPTRVAQQSRSTLKQILPEQQAYNPEQLLNKAGSERLQRNPMAQQANMLQIGNFLGGADSGVAETEVPVSPLVGTDAGDHVVLTREAQLDGDTWRQGLVLEKAAWEAHLADTVVVKSGLADVVTLEWSGTGEGFAHTFAPPLNTLTVHASVARIPEPGIPREAYIGALAALVAIVTAGGLAVVWRSAREAVEYAQRRADFAATVTHELKTPLTTIRMYSEMLEAGMVPDPEKQRRYHGRIRAEAERLGVLVDSVLSAAKLQKGLELPEGPPATLGEVLAAVAEATHVSDRGFTLELHLDPEVAASVVARDAMLQALVNLVDNAMKFARGTDHRIEVHAWRDVDHLVVVVRDHGPGVPEDELARLFDPFYRPRMEMVRQTRGAGLGLAIVRGLATQMGGTVVARNHPEGGFVAELRVILRESTA